MLILVATAVAFPLAQAAATADRFEVASVKSYSGPLTMISANTEPGGRFTAQQQSLRDLIALAYRMRDSQIVGGLAWIGSDRFDVNAKAAHDRG